MDIRDAAKISDFVREQVAKVEKASTSAASDANSAEWTAKAEDTNKKTDIFTREFLPAFNETQALLGKDASQRASSLAARRAMFTRGDAAMARVLTGYEQKLAGAYRILKPAVEANLRADGVPAKDIPEKIGSLLDDMADDVLATWDPKQGINGWPRVRAEAIGKETKALVDARDASERGVSEYARAVSMPPEMLQELREFLEKWANSEKSTEDKIEFLRRNAKDWEERAKHAKEYRKAFDRLATRAGLSPEAEWEKRKAIETTPVYDLVRGLCSPDAIITMARAEIDKVDNMCLPGGFGGGHKWAAKFKDESREYDGRLEAELAALRATPAGPAVSGSVVAIDADGKKSVATFDGNVAKDAEGNPLKAGTMVLATLDTGGVEKQDVRFLVVGANGTAVLQPPATPGGAIAGGGISIRR